MKTDPITPPRPTPDLNPADLMTIRAMCDTFDVTPRTLRFYEQKELLFPQRRGMRRLFTRRDRARLTLILRGKRFGFTLEDIRQLLDMYDRDGNAVAQMQASYDMAHARLAQMEAERAALDQAIAELKDQLMLGAESLGAKTLATGPMTGAHRNAA